MNSHVPQGAVGKEIRIPFNRAGLRQVGRDLQRAGGIAQPATDEKESAA